ncbi:MAG: N-methyl-L-tryptophan oxidase [Planctomycetota bacterium]
MIYDSIVLGTGGIGSAAVYHLARRQARVLGLDRYPAAHDRGSSHGQTRIIRLAYFEHPDYVPLLRRAFELWHDLEQHAQETLYHPVGLLQAGPATGDVVPGVLKSAELHNLDIEQLTAQDIRQRFTGFDVPDHFVGVFEKQAGFLRVEACVAQHLRLAQEHGADLRYGEQIIGWHRDGQQLIVTTDRQTYATRRLIVTAGPWAASLLHSLPVPLTVLRKHLHWYEPVDGRYELSRGGCTFLFELPDGVYYGFPQVPGNADGVKIAEHSGGEPIDNPQLDPRQLDVTEQRRVESFIERCLPGITLRHRRHAVCHYTMSPDGHFLVDRDPTDQNVLFVAGLSGHGFKFAAVLGEVLAQLALDGHTPQPIDFLSLRRFQDR